MSANSFMPRAVKKTAHAPAMAPMPSSLCRALLFLSPCHVARYARPRIVAAARARASGAESMGFCTQSANAAGCLRVRKTALAVTASITLEQSYDEVDGDSASVAEMFALLSALADLPVRQDLAVTGSLNQKGDVQAVGGVNEKIEGFFDLCAARGLTGTQGVLLPASNLPHLMLQPRVVEAVRARRFHIYAISRVEEGVTLLTGLPVGAPGADGLFPLDTVFGRVQEKLRRLAEASRGFLGWRGEGV